MREHQFTEDYRPANNVERLPPDNSSFSPRTVFRDVPRQTPPSSPVTERELPGLLPVDRAKILRARVRPRMDMLPQNISQAGRLRRPLRNIADTGPRQYARFSAGPARVIDRNSPENYAPWWMSERIDEKR